MRYSNTIFLNGIVHFVIHKLKPFIQVAPWIKWNTLYINVYFIQSHLHTDGVLPKTPFIFINREQNFNWLVRNRLFP